MGRKDQSKPPAKVNVNTPATATAASKGYSEKYLSGSDKYGDSIKPESRPKPNQGTKVFTPGVGTTTYGGSQPGAVPITGNVTPPTPPKTPGRVATFFKGVKGGGLGPMLGGGGPFNKID
jgi:hypothetical protein